MHTSLPHQSHSSQKGEIELLRKKNSGFTAKALIVGILLIPVNCYWVVGGESVYNSYSPSGVALFSNVVFTIFALVIFNLLIERFLTHLKLTQAELLTIYVMLCMATSIGGHGFVQILPPLMGHAFWFATPENEWQQLFWRHLPVWLIVSDKTVLKGYYEGDSSLLYEHIKTWLTPLLWWSAFVFAFIYVMLCINIIVRKQWIDQDKLAYPIIQLPLAITRQENSSRLLRSRLLWIGFVVAAGIDIFNGLSYLYPSIPYVPVKVRDIGYLFSEKPFSAIGWLPISFYPAMIGLAFFIPLSLSFSAWFFYLSYKLQRVIGSVAGLSTLPGFPDNDSQSSGAYIALFVIALWGTRAHLSTVFTQCFNKQKFDPQLRFDETDEPMHYRSATLNLTLAMAFITVFCLKANMTLGVIMAFFAIYYAIATAIARMRAELGAPIHDLHFVGPDQMITDFVGTRYLQKANLSLFSLFWFFNRAHYSDIMPQQLEGLKIAAKVGIDNRKLLYAMIIAIVVAIPTTFWVILHFMYKLGATSSVVGYHVGPAWESFNRLQRWHLQPTDTNWTAVGFTSFGFLFTVILMVMRTHFIWWPFHPTGYAIAGSWAMGIIWLPILISWLVKLMIMQYGGLKMHRQAGLFFIGLILGEFIIGGIWSIMGMTLNIRTYKVWV